MLTLICHVIKTNVFNDITRPSLYFSRTLLSQSGSHARLQAGLADPCRLSPVGNGPTERAKPTQTPHLLLSHGHSHIVGHGPIDPVHTETTQNKQLLESGDVVVITQGEWELLQRIQVVPLQRAGAGTVARAVQRGPIPWEPRSCCGGRESAPSLGAVTLSPKLRFGKGRPEP